MMKPRDQGYVPPKIKSNFESYRKKWNLLKQGHSKSSECDKQLSQDSVRERFADLIFDNRIPIINDNSVTGVYRSRLQEAMELAPILRIRSDMKRSRKDIQERQQKKLLAELYARNRKKQLELIDKELTKSNLLPLPLVFFDFSTSGNVNVGKQTLLIDDNPLPFPEPILNQIPFSRMA